MIGGAGREQLLSPPNFGASCMEGFPIRIGNANSEYPSADTKDRRIDFSICWQKTTHLCRRD